MTIWMNEYVFHFHFHFHFVIFVFYGTLNCLPRFDKFVFTLTIQRNRLHTKICVEHHKMQKNTNNANKTRVLLQTTGGKDEPNIVSMRKPQRTLRQFEWMNMSFTFTSSSLFLMVRWIVYLASINLSLHFQ
jgi:hypothetical protein